MKIKKILSQHRNDFTAIMKCEHCNHEQQLNTGYNDANYHDNVIPRISCMDCDKTTRGYHLSRDEAISKLWLRFEEKYGNDLTMQEMKSILSRSSHDLESEIVALMAYE